MADNVSSIPDITDQSMRDEIDGPPAYFQQTYQKERLLEHWESGNLFTREEVEEIMSQRDKFQRELEKANNEFGCQTAHWTGLANRIAELKKRANQPYQEGFSQGLGDGKMWYGNLNNAITEAEERGRKRGLEEAQKIIQEAIDNPLLIMGE